jgi:hypothetical protein
VAYLLLAFDPTGERGAEGIGFDPAGDGDVFTFVTDGGGTGFVRDQVLEQERLVMLFDLTWLPA